MKSLKKLADEGPFFTECSCGWHSGYLRSSPTAVTLYKEHRKTAHPPLETAVPGAGENRN